MQTAAVTIHSALIGSSRFSAMPPTANAAMIARHDPEYPFTHESPSHSARLDLLSVGVARPLQPRPQAVTSHIRK